MPKKRQKKKHRLKRNFFGKRYMSTTERKRVRLWMQQGGRCYFCGRSHCVEVTTIEHLIPKSEAKKPALRRKHRLKGHSDWKNLAASCLWCNTKRGTKDALEFRYQVARFILKHGPEKLGPLNYKNTREARKQHRISVAKRKRESYRAQKREERLEKNAVKSETMKKRFRRKVREERQKLRRAEERKRYRRSAKKDLPPEGQDA